VKEEAELYQSGSLTELRFLPKIIEFHQMILNQLIQLITPKHKVNN